jgi:hypothetical protein
MDFRPPTTRDAPDPSTTSRPATAWVLLALDRFAAVTMPARFDPQPRRGKATLAPPSSPRPHPSGVLLRKQKYGLVPRLLATRDDPLGPPTCDRREWVISDRTAHRAPPLARALRGGHRDRGARLGKRSPEFRSGRGANGSATPHSPEYPTGAIAVIRRRRVE